MPDVSDQATTGEVSIQGERLLLRTVVLDDANDRYLSWMNDPEVTQYLESRFASYGLADLKAYINQVNREKDTLFLAIIDRATSQHVGNIKLGPINQFHKFADIGIMIGDKTRWGRGYASEAIQLLSEYAFAHLGLHKLIAGAYRDNVGCINAFLKAGWEQEGLRQTQYRLGDRYVDLVCLGKLRPE